MCRLVLVCALSILILPSYGSAATTVPSGKPYRVIKTAKVGGEGGFDYVDADPVGRRLYVARRSNPPAVHIYNLDTLAQVGIIPNVSAHGVAVDPKFGHAFATSKPVAMWDTKTLKIIKKVDVRGDPDGILGDPVAHRIYILSHAEPNVTVINATNGAIIGTINLGGAPEQAVLDDRGHMYVDIEDKANIAVVDTKTLAVRAHYDLAGKGGTCAGLAIDVKNRILFAACRAPQNMVILSAGDGKILTTLPIGKNSDGAVFNPNTMEAFCAGADGTLTVVKETSPTSFAVEQTVLTKPSAKTLTLDTKTNRIFLIAADYTVLPTPPSPGVRPRPGKMVPNSFSILVVGR